MPGITHYRDCNAEKVQRPALHGHSWMLAVTTACCALMYLRLQVGRARNVHHSTATYVYFGIVKSEVINATSGKHVWNNATMPLFTRRPFNPCTSVLCSLVKAGGIRKVSTGVVTSFQFGALKIQDRIV